MGMYNELKLSNFKNDQFNQIKKIQNEEENTILNLGIDKDTSHFLK